MEDRVIYPAAQPAKKKSGCGGTIFSFLLAVLAVCVFNWFTEEVAAPQPEFVAETLYEVRDNLPQTKDGETISVLFEYTGEEELTFQRVAAMLGASSGSLTNVEGDLWKATFQPYAGDRILRAHRLNDQSDLDLKEKMAYKKALTLVEQARVKCDSEMEVMLCLHDWMMENITYFEYDFSLENSDNAPLNAVGALLDGEANCQGYTDCFYLLASLAGFQVDRQSTDTHSFNTVELDGKWYIVDVTFNDADVFNSDAVSKDGFSLYRLFCAGKEHCNDYEWEAFCERHPIEKESGPYQYYRLIGIDDEDHSYDRYFTDLSKMAKTIISEYRGGRKNVCVMLDGVEITSDALFDAMRNAAQNPYTAYTCSVVVESVGGDTFCFIRFK